MINKKVSLEVTQGRSVATFFKRNLENFDRKFDGFPAIQLSVPSTPAVQEGSDDYGHFDAQDIIDQITASSGWAYDSSTAPCADVDDPTKCSPSEGYGCVIWDRFNRTGATLGLTEDGFHEWEESGSDNGGSNGSEAVLADAIGFTTGGSLVRNGKIRVEDESLSLPLDVTFSFRYTGNWTNTYAYNETLTHGDFPLTGQYNAPGYAVEPTAYRPSHLSWATNILWVNISTSIPMAKFKIYNAGGSLYVTNWQENSVVPNSIGPPTLVSAQLEPDTLMHVKVHSDSDQSHIRVWLDGQEEPDFYQRSTRAGWGANWDGGLEIEAESAARVSTIPSYSLFVDNICVSAPDSNLGISAIKTNSESWVVSDYPYPGGTIDQDNLTGTSTLNAHLGWSGSIGSTVAKEARFIHYEATNEDLWPQLLTARFVDNLQVYSYSGAPEIRVAIVNSAYSSAPDTPDYLDGEVVWDGVIPASVGGEASYLDVEGSFNLIQPGRCQLYLRLISPSDLPEPAAPNWGVNITNIIPIVFPYEPENLNAGGEDCSGQTINEKLNWDGDRYVTTSGVAKSFVDVWYDDLMAVKDIDYTEDGGIVPISTLPEGTVVRARYIVE